MSNWRERILEQADAARRAAEIDLDQLRREDEAESSGFFGGFALGVLVGAMLALVFAPWKGEETRELVTDRALRLKDRATDLVHQVRGDDDDPVAAETAIEREIDEVAPA